MYWFGRRPWPSEELRAPVCMDDDERVEVPVGELCLFCSEAIEEGDRGELMASVDGVRAVHIECIFRQVMGGPAHLQGTCLCQGGEDDPDLDMSPRDASLWVWEHHTKASGFYKYDDPPEEGRTRV